MFNMMCSLSVLNDRSGAPGVRGRVKDRAAPAKRRRGSRFSSATTGSARILVARDPPKKMVGTRRPGSGDGTSVVKVKSESTGVCIVGRRTLKNIRHSIIDQIVEK